MALYNNLVDNKNNIKCPYHDKESRNYYITENLKVLPCCYYATTILAPSVAGKIQELDPVFYETSKMHPDWNDISKYTIKEIESHTIYKHHLFEEGWNSDSPSGICMKHCRTEKNQKLVK